MPYFHTTIYNIINNSNNIITGSKDIHPGEDEFSIIVTALTQLHFKLSETLSSFSEFTTSVYCTLYDAITRVTE